MTEPVQLYPAWRFHATLGTKVVQSAAEDAALEPGWVDTPAKFEPQVEQPIVEEPPGLELPIVEPEPEPEPEPDEPEPEQLPAPRRRRRA